MARIAVVFTGGTISMAFDADAGGNVPSLDGAAILARTPGLDKLADVVPIDRGLTPASHFSFADVLAIGARVQTALDDPAIDGAVVVQGTDTIEETSFAWDLVLASPKPVVVTGAMRAAHEDGYDGPANLRRAVAAAASPALRGAGVVVTLAGTLEAADDAVKLHTSALDTFRSPNGGTLGSVGDDGTVTVTRARGSRRSLRPVPSAGAVVHHVQAGIGTDGALLDAAIAAGAQGIVVAATGAGNTHPGLLAAAQRAMADDVVVALASRCVAGGVSTAYAFPGGGGTWVRAGAIRTGTLCAIKARVALALALGAGLGRDGIAALLADPLG
ncbi:MAG TPA: asparaginase [Candidatus Limnocylindrales bacterium]|nr:asparaginase [Candidatus Limnocylindrales bacterium]